MRANKRPALDAENAIALVWRHLARASEAGRYVKPMNLPLACARMGPAVRG